MVQELVFRLSARDGSCDTPAGRSSGLRSTRRVSNRNHFKDRVVIDQLAAKLRSRRWMNDGLAAVIAAHAMLAAGTVRDVSPIVTGLMSRGGGGRPLGQGPRDSPRMTGSETSVSLPNSTLPEDNRPERTLGAGVEWAILDSNQ